MLSDIADKVSYNNEFIQAKYDCFVSSYSNQTTKNSHIYTKGEHIAVLMCIYIIIYRCREIIYFRYYLKQC